MRIIVKYLKGTISPRYTHPYNLMIALPLILLLALNSLFLSAYDWPQFNGDPTHSGSNTKETLITRANVTTLKRIFQVALPDPADGAPAFLSGDGTPGSDRIFITTKAGSLVALDAHTGAQLWVHDNPAGSCKINKGSDVCFTTSSPAIEPSGQYVYSYGLDGYVHKYTTGDGSEIKKDGWPELTSLKPWNEKGSSALTIAVAHNGTPYLYVAQGGYPGDGGDYQGHLTTINLKDGTQHIFNTVCSDQIDQHFVDKPGAPNCPERTAAIWGRAGVTYDPETDRIYTATGNGPFDPAKHYWGDSVLALNPDGTGHSGDPVDSYTPTDFQNLQDADADLGSTVPVILPVPPSSNIHHLGLQTGKDSRIHLLNLDNLSGQGGAGHTGGAVALLSVPQGGQVLAAPVVWVNPADQATWVFIANGSGISAFRLVVDGNGNPNLQLAWQNKSPGASPVVAGGVLYYAKSKIIEALDPLTGQLLWKDSPIGVIHWQSPVVANGLLYIADLDGNLTAYAPYGIDNTTAFQRVWAHTDKPVIAGVVARSWLWGKAPFDTSWEPYAESPAGLRQTLYFDKSRMEINHPSADTSSEWYVTNGLLVVELMTGRRQTGDNSFVQYTPSNGAIAGDNILVNPNAPTYATFARVSTLQGTNNQTSNAIGQGARLYINKDGTVTSGDAHGVNYAYYDAGSGHNIPDVFWTFMHQQGTVWNVNNGQYSTAPLFDWVFVMGLPISEPYWTTVKVGGQERLVMVQAFQRRILTYTPANDPAWRVEMGNVGRHYHDWLNR